MHIEMAMARRTPSGAMIAATIGLACLCLSFLSATSAEATPKNLQGKTIQFTYTSSTSGLSCVHRSSIRIARDQLFYGHELISCGEGAGENLPKGYGWIIPVNGTAPVKNACKSNYGDRVERCTDGYVRKRNGKMRASETWSGSVSSKVTESKIQVHMRRNTVGRWSTTDGGGGTYNVNQDYKLAISVSGKGCQVTEYRLRITGSTTAAHNFRSSQKCSISG